MVEEGPAGLSGVVAPVDSHAAGTPFDADAANDGRIVADLVAEWAGTHGEPFTLALSGPAGGLFAAGTGGAQVELVRDRVLPHPGRAGARGGRPSPPPTTLRPPNPSAPSPERNRAHGYHRGGQPR